MGGLHIPFVSSQITLHTFTSAANPIMLTVILLRLSFSTVSSMFPGSCVDRDPYTTSISLEPSIAVLLGAGSDFCVPGRHLPQEDVGQLKRVLQGGLAPCLRGVFLPEGSRASGEVA